MNDNKVFTGKGCSVVVIEDSLSQIGRTRLCTLQLTYWRAIHAELMTHRVLSRNASSSRAIPTERLLKQIETQPAKPVHWGRNQSGMQARDEHDETIVHPVTGDLLTREEAWVAAAKSSVGWARAFADAGFHKQITNRISEPFSYISVVVSATQWDNFFELRAHEDAQPEIQDLAYTMKEAMRHSSPRLLHPGKLSDPRVWHLPYVNMHERQSNSSSDLLAMSAARCARVSYLTHDRQHPKKEDDIALYRRLVESKPLHASPLEHQAYAAMAVQPSANFTGGWVQHRRFLELQGSIEKLQQTLNNN
jgi:thymidylate synthase ThyX